MNIARLAAARTLISLERGRTTMAAEAERERKDLPAVRDKGLFLEITAGTVRWRAELDACLSARSTRSLESLTPEVRAVLRTGAYQLLHLDRVPPHAAVSESVEVIRALGQPRASGFVNAVLRKLVSPSARKALPKRPSNSQNRAAAIQYLAITLSHPQWLVTRWLDRVGFDAAERWCQFNNSAPSITIRPADGRSVRVLNEQLQELGIEAAPARFAGDALVLAPGGLGRLPPDLRSAIAVQDEGSLLVAQATGARPGEIVLDVCAAPGGKTMVLADRVGAGGRVVASDFRRGRVALLAAQVQRSAAAVPILALDATKPLPFRPVFDRVLLDAPCSGVGTLRRDPDLKWSRREEDLASLAAAQTKMISRAADVLRPGGVLIYSTCSSEPEENDAIVREFLSTHPDFHLEPITDPALAGLTTADGLLQTSPPRDNLDAFFAARLVRGV